MADTKISALTASTTPLAGTEVLPIVQSGVTKQVSVANLTAGRAISATQLTLTTGNLIVASGQGIDFSATPGTGTSELLDDYEEGTWTPDQGAGLTVIGTFASSGNYTKVGNLVTVYGKINPSVSVAVNSGAAITNTLPFTATVPGCGVTSNINASATATNLVGSASTVLYSNTVISATGQIEFTAVYYA